MGALKKQELATVESVARHFSATWQTGVAPPDAWLTIAGKRIALEVITIRQQIADDAAKPRLRFDKEVIRLVSHLQTTLSDSVPDDRAVVVTVAAPIRLGSKTAAALEDRIGTCLARRSARFDREETIHGNQVRFRLVKTGSARASKVIGFVHNPDPVAANILLDLTEALLEGIGAAAGKPAPARLKGERWLVVADAHAPPPVETYRQVHAQLSIPNVFANILLAFGDGRIGILTGELLA